MLNPTLSNDRIFELSKLRFCNHCYTVPDLSTLVRRYEISLDLHTSEFIQIYKYLRSLDMNYFHLSSSNFTDVYILNTDIMLQFVLKHRAFLIF